MTLLHVCISSFRNELIKTVNYICKNRIMLCLFVVYFGALFILHQLFCYRLTHVQLYSRNCCHSAGILMSMLSAAAPSTTPASSQRPLYSAWLPDENWQSWGKCAEINDYQSKMIVLWDKCICSHFTALATKDQRQHQHSDCVGNLRPKSHSAAEQTIKMQQEMMQNTLAS